MQIVVVQRVADSLAPVAGAQVELIPPGGGEPLTGTTDESGAVRFDGLPNGVRYTIRVTAGGFEDLNTGQLPPDTVPVAGLVTQFVELTPLSG